jgi:hypothetical protein
MSLKTAIVIAVIGLVLDSLFSLLQAFDLVKLNAPEEYKIYFIFRMLLSNGSMILFLAVLLSKQSRD